MKIGWGISWRLALMFAVAIVVSASTSAIDASELYVLPNRISVDSGSGNYQTNTPVVYKIVAVDDKFGPIVASSSTAVQQLSVLNNDRGANGLSGNDSKLKITGLSSQCDGSYTSEINTAYARIGVNGNNLSYKLVDYVTKDVNDQFYYRIYDQYSKQTAVAKVAVSLKAAKVSLAYDDRVTLASKVSDLAVSDTALIADGNVEYTVEGSVTGDGSMHSSNDEIKTMTGTSSVLASKTWGYRLACAVNECLGDNDELWHGLTVGKVPLKRDISGRHVINITYGANTAAATAGNYSTIVIYQITAEPAINLV